MKIILQDKTTLMFLEKVDSWTSDPTRGLTFDTAFGALTFCASNHLENVEFVTRLQLEEMEAIADVATIPNGGTFPAEDPIESQPNR